MKYLMIQIALCLFFNSHAIAQYDFVVKAIDSSQNLRVRNIEGSFINVHDSLSKRKKNHYLFKCSEVTIDYYESASANECDEFVVEGFKVSMKGKFYNDNVACYLDVNSFKVYDFYFSSRHYLCVQCVKNGSGHSTSVMIFNLFDITQKSKVIYYPLWSFFGTSLCFGDFNKDGRLDFLNIIDNWKETGPGSFKVSLLSLNFSQTKFIKSFPEKYAIVKKIDLDGDNSRVTVTRNSIH